MYVREGSQRKMVKMEACYHSVYDALSKIPWKYLLQTKISGLGVS